MPRRARVLASELKMERRQAAGSVGWSAKNSGVPTTPTEVRPPENGITQVHASGEWLTIQMFPGSSPSGRRSSVMCVRDRVFHGYLRTPEPNPIGPGGGESYWNKRAGQSADDSDEIRETLTGTSVPTAIG